MDGIDSSLTDTDQDAIPSVSGVVPDAGAFAVADIMLTDAPGKRGVWVSFPYAAGAPEVMRTPAVAEVDILVDVRFIEVDQMVAVALGAVQQGTQLLDEGCPPSWIGTAKQLAGLLPRQAKPVQGGADGFAAARLGKPRLHKANQPLERPAGLRVGSGYGWAGGPLLGRADFLAKSCLDAGAKRGRPPVR